MMQGIADGACPGLQLTARGRDMHRLSGNVVEHMSAGKAGRQCHKEGRRKYRAAVRELAAKAGRGASGQGPRQCRVAALYLDGLLEATGGEAYYERK
jgi:hypothetical protein